MQKFNMRPGVQTKMNTSSSTPKLSSSAQSATVATSAKVGGGSSISERAASGIALRGDTGVFTFPRTSSKPFFNTNGSAAARNAYVRPQNTTVAYGMFAQDPIAMSQRESKMNRTLNALNAQNTYGMLNQMQANNPMDLASVAKMSFDIGKNIIGLVKDVKASNTTSSLSTTSTSSASNANNANTSAEVKQSITDIDTKQAKLEGEIKKLNEQIETDTKTLSDTTTKLGKVETQITSENQNIQRQAGTIMKLESQITMQKSMLSTSTGLAKTGLENQIAQMEKQLQEAKDSKEASEKNLKEKLEPQKESLTGIKENTEKALRQAKADVESKTIEKESLQKTEDKLTKKLDKLEDKEDAKLDKMYSELMKINNDFRKETDEGKKSKLKAEYAKQVKDYNALAASTTVEEHKGKSLATELS